MAQSVQIIGVSPRDGIQKEKKLLSLETKFELIGRAVKAGASRIEVTSFVNPKRVPQMADADEVCNALQRDTGCKYIGLALNRRGFERAGIHTGVDLQAAIEAAEIVEAALGKTVPGMVMKAGAFPKPGTSAA